MNITPRIFGNRLFKKMWQGMIADASSWGYFLRMGDIREIKAYLKLSESLFTSGMPTADQFEDIAQAGCKFVINLALPTSDNALANEGEIVTRLGMAYCHIPVIFDSPQEADFLLFSRILSAAVGQKVWVHCAANMRVSAFMFLHRVIQEQTPPEQALQDLTRIWAPDSIWLDFINQQLSKAKLANI